MANGSRVKDAAGNIGTASNLSPSIVRRVAQGLRYAVTGVGPNDWFGPAQPIAPVAQEPAEGRVLDYPVAYNLRQQPRQDEAISFEQLRGLADNCNFLRLVIETRKDQMEKLTWNVQPRLKSGMKPSDLLASRETDSRITKLETFFHKPDGHNSWTTWLRQLCEELLVTDAVSIYRRRNQGGQLYGLQQIDGATIKRVIDSSGLTPLPPDPAYQQILHGLPAVNYTADQLLYLPRNPRIHRLYGNSPVEQVVMTVNIALRRSVAQLNYFTEGNIPEALISCPPDWRPQQIQEMQEIFDDMLRGNLAERSGAKFVPGGLNVQFMKEALLKDDFDEWLVRIICYAFSVSPTPFTKQTNRATAESVHQAALQEGLAPLQNWVKGLIDRVLAEDFAAPDLEFAWNDDKAMAPTDAMTVNVGYVAAGLKTRNEVRRELGLDPIDSGDEVTITAGNTVTRLSDALAPPQPQLPTAEVEQPETGAATRTSDGKAPKLRIVKSVDANGDEVPATEDHEDRLTSEIVAVLRKQGDGLAARIAGTEHTLSTAAEELERAQEAGALDLDSLYAPTAAILEANAADSAHEALEALPATANAGDELTVSITNQEITSLVNQDAVEFANHRAAELIGKKVVDGKLVDNPDAKWAITDTTRDGIRDLVKQAEKTGKSVQDLANDIRRSALFSPERAKRIAQWELSQSANHGNLIAWKRSGVVENKRALLGSEHAICDQCDTNVKAGAIGLDALFPSGHLCAPFHPECVCTTVPELRTK